MSIIVEDLVLRGLFTGLRAIAQAAQQAQENKAALQELSDYAEKNVKPQLEVIQARVKIHKDQEYLRDSINRLAESLEEIKGQVETWGQRKGRYKMMMDAIFGSGKKMMAEIEDAKKGLDARLDSVKTMLQTKVAESQDALFTRMEARFDEINAKLDGRPVGNGVQVDAKQTFHGYDWSMSENSIDFEKGPLGPSPRAILGSGGYATVFKGVWKGGYDGGEIAIKALLDPQKVHDDDKERKRFEREVNMLYGLNHKNIVSFFGAIRVTSENVPMYWIATELLSTKLSVFLSEDPQAKDQDVKIRIIQGMASGLSYLHSRAILHRDIKPDNVMMDFNGEVKIIDFGMSKMKEMHQQSQGASTKCGTQHWISPEKDQGKPSSAASDVYSLGLVIANVLLLQTPSQLKPKGGVELSLKQSERSNEDPLYKITCCLAVRCLHQSPDKRPKCLDIASTIRDAQQSSGTPGRIGCGVRMQAMVEEDSDSGRQNAHEDTTYIPEPMSGPKAGKSVLGDRCDGELEVGTHVEIHSLQQSSELNGIRGKILKPFDRGSGRYEVDTATGRVVALKPDNIRVASRLGNVGAKAAAQSSFLDELDVLRQRRDIQKIVQGMSDTVPQRHVQEKACEVLLDLIPNVEGNEWQRIVSAQGAAWRALMSEYETFANFGAISAVIMALSRHADSATLVMCVGKLLAHLARSDECRAEIVRMDGIECMVNVMNKYRGHSGVQERACRMFMNTAATTNRGVKSRLSESRVVDAIKEALRNHSEHEKIQEYGAATFRNMQFEEHRARCDGCQIAPIFGTRWR